MGRSQTYQEERSAQQAQRQWQAQVEEQQQRVKFLIPITHPSWSRVDGPFNLIAKARHWWQFVKHLKQMWIVYSILDLMNLNVSDFLQLLASLDKLSAEVQSKNGFSSESWKRDAWKLTIMSILLTMRDSHTQLPNRMLFVQISTLPPIVHQKLTKHGMSCIQNNQLPTKGLAEWKDNSIEQAKFYL